MSGEHREDIPPSSGVLGAPHHSLLNVLYIAVSPLRVRQAGRQCLWPVEISCFLMLKRPASLLAIGMKAFRRVVGALHFVLLPVVGERSFDYLIWL